MENMYLDFGKFKLKLTHSLTGHVPEADPFAALREFPQSWGYADVRQGAHKFYWLFNTTHADGPTNRPLILWLQVRKACGRYFAKPEF